MNKSSVEMPRRYPDVVFPFVVSFPTERFRSNGKLQENDCQGKLD